MNGHTLGSIQERDEDVDWVPKNKHDVLKAKYKCLKKLFQIYDATMSSPLPEESQPAPKRRSKKHRPKADAVVGTSETALNTKSPDPHDIDQKTYTFASTQHSYCCLPKDSVQSFNYKTEEGPSLQRASSLGTSGAYGRRRKMTRLRYFLVRLFGRQPRRLYTQSHSENAIRWSPKRRRRGLRFRRVKLLQIRSEPAMTVLSCVQSVQQSCLADTTRRQCPFVACHARFCGIINYNDHLNICHFPDRQHICHYCHEGYSSKSEKMHHENQHLGIAASTQADRSDAIICPSRHRNLEKTDDVEIDAKLIENSSPPPYLDDKRKKIVSFYDRRLDRGSRVSETTITKRGVASQDKLSMHWTKQNTSEVDGKDGLKAGKIEKDNVDLVSKHGSIQVTCDNQSLYAVSENSLAKDNVTDRYSELKSRHYSYKWEPGH